MDGRDDAIDPWLARDETSRDARKNALVDFSIDARVAKRRPRRRRASRVPRPGAAFPLDARSGGVRDSFTSRESYDES
jgi:hypothetical protein